MTWAIKNYRLFIIVTGVILIVLIAWMIFSRQDSSKIPTRGVFI